MGRLSSRKKKQRSKAFNIQKKLFDSMMKLGKKSKTKVEVKIEDCDTIETYKSKQIKKESGE